MQSVRIIPVIVIGAIAAHLAACGGQSASGETTQASSTASSGGESPAPASSASASASPAPSAPVVNEANASPPATTDDRPHELPGTSIRFEGGDGTSADQAIVIVGAQGETDGTRAEYQYIALVYGRGAAPIHMRGQALLVHNSHHLDMLRFEQGGIEKQIYFDIEQYFGRF